MDDAELQASLKDNGFVFVPGEDVAMSLSPEARKAWPSFAESWEYLSEDLYMADGGRYRRRRHAAFESGDVLHRLPQQPHYQSRDYNPLNGGVERWFDPVMNRIAASPVLADLVSMARDFIKKEIGNDPGLLFMEMHQFRIEAIEDTVAQPTPEGMHRDGVDWVMVVLIGRDNVSEGETKLAGADREPVGAFTLSVPMDLVFLDDWRVFHGVTPIKALDPSRPGTRDVLVLTFKRQDHA